MAESREEKVDGLSRRQALKRLGTAGAGLFALGPVVRWEGLGGAADPVAVTATAVSEATLRLTIAPAEAAPAAVPLDGALLEASWEQRVRLAGSGREDVAVGQFHVSVQRDPLRIVVSRGGRTVQALGLEDTDGALTFELGSWPLLGMGQGGPQYDRRGAVDRMRSGQGGYQLSTHGARVPIQWLVSAEGWALYIHQPLGSFDLSGGRGRFTPPETAKLPLDVFVVAGADPAVILGEWARLTGRPELPPRWSLGYQQSHRTLTDASEVLWVARTLREKRLPCDTLIYLGTGFAPSGWNTNNGEFRWNPAVFSDPEAVLKELHELGFRVVLHAVLEGRRLTGRVSDPCPEPPAPGATGSGRDWPREQQVPCYWPIHRPMVEQGIDGWWPDQGDGLDAPSRLNRIRMYYEGMLSWRPDERPFALHRNGYAGMARYGAFLWSGDVVGTWETLRTQVPVGINTGLSGIPFWGTDIGGFNPSRELTGELYVRWFQFGAFCPLFRAHGRTWHLRLPWGWNTGGVGHDEVANSAERNVYPDPSEFRNPAVEPICRQYLELRYRLLPYLYTAVRETHERGLPIMRALWIHYPDDARAATCGDQYLWGRDILVAPVLEKGASEREVYLPAGMWYDYWTGERLNGGRTVRRAVDLATMPLYVRAGAVLPLDPVRQHQGEPLRGPTELVVYPGADGSTSIYDDDGRSLGYQRGEWSRTGLHWDDARRRLTIAPAAGSPQRGPHARELSVRLVGEERSRAVGYEGARVEVGL